MFCVQKKQREHRLVFETPSLLDRGWLAALSGAEDFSKTAVCPGVGKAPSLSCVLFAATPPGRVAVAPLRFLSKAASQGSVFEKGEREATGEEGGRRKGRRVLCLDARAARAIPWVSLEGLVRLRRNSRDRALALWFGGEEHVPDLECFYENAPFSVGLAAASGRAAECTRPLRDSQTASKTPRGVGVGCLCRFCWSEKS